MDSIDKALIYAETGDKTKDGPSRIYDAIDSLSESNPYYFLQWWTNTIEFQRAKLTRSNALPTTDEGEKNVKITVVDGTESNTPIS